VKAHDSSYRLKSSQHPMAYTVLWWTAWNAQHDKVCLSRKRQEIRSMTEGRRKRHCSINDYNAGSNQGQIQGGAIGAIAPVKPTKVTLFTMILHNLENSIHDIRPFCRQLLCHSNVVKYTSSLVQQWTRNETWLPNFTEISPLNLQAGSTPGSN